ncbi:hypothetical protein AB0J81_05725 [Streptomyces bobili]|uniref:hypothetical protein n=1 Tax=Streptomyces bobili TaxID=67280 RepID=UPI003422CECD
MAGLFWITSRAGPARWTGTSPSGAYRAHEAVVRLPDILTGAHVVYRWVSRNRHRLPGGTPAYAVPPSATK